MLAAVLLAVCLQGCATQPGTGNSFTYSGNSAGEQTGSVIKQCAEAVVELLKEHPEVDGDAIFARCKKDNGVTFI